MSSASGLYVANDAYIDNSKATLHEIVRTMIFLVALRNFFAVSKELKWPFHFDFLSFFDQGKKNKIKLFF